MKTKTGSSEISPHGRVASLQILLLALLMLEPESFIIERIRLYKVATLAIIGA